MTIRLFASIIVSNDSSHHTLVREMTLGTYVPALYRIDELCADNRTPWETQR